MAPRSIEFRVGLVVIAALIIFVAAVVWVQGYRFGRENYRVAVIFDEVGSLAKGDPVMVSGIRKGKVQDLSLTENGVRVELTLSDDVVLKKDAEITVKNIGLMGERFIAVRPGKAAEIYDPALPVVGNYDTGIPEVMGMMGEMIGELRNLVHSLKNSIASDTNLNRFSNVVKNFEELSHSLSDYFNRNSHKLDQTAENFLRASVDLKKLTHDNVGRIDSTLLRVDSSSRQIAQLVGDLAITAAAARDFAARLDSGNGTLQMLVDDRRLYDDLRRTADNIDALVNDIRSNPQKYIKLRVEIF